MTTTAIELLVIGSTPPEIEGYSVALRNTGTPVHARQIRHDIEELNSALTKQVDLILYTMQPDEAGIAEVVSAVNQSDQECSILALSSDYDEDLRTHAIAEGCNDLVSSKHNELLVQVAKREYQNLLIRRNLLDSQQKLLETEHRCEILTDSSRDPFAYVHEGMHIKANKAYLSAFGYMDEDEIAGLPILDMIAPAEHTIFKKLLRKLSADDPQIQNIESTCVRSDGSEFSAELSFSPAVFEGEPCFQVLVQTHKVSQELEAKIYALSTQDPHTGLCNRQFFCNKLDEILSEPDQPKPALLYITLDNFSDLRGKLGMRVSDDIILELAQLLKNNTTEDNALTRFGDHTFTLLTTIPDQQESQLKEFTEQLHGTIKDFEFQSEIQEIHPTCSIGVAEASASINSSNEFINLAYLASDKARNYGGNQIFYAEELTDDSQPAETEVAGSEADLDRLIKTALENNQFRLVFQPIVSLHGDTRENYAVLVRLLDNNQEEIHPDHFMPQVRSLGLMPKLDRWVIENAVIELAKHRAEGKKINFFINIARESIEDENLLLWICDCLRDNEAKGTWFTFQFNSNDMTTHLPEVGNLLEGLKKIKCKVSVDHYGLSPKPDAWLNKLPIDYVQFDHQFLDKLSEDQEKQDKLNKLNQMAQEAKIKTIAAGVEDTNSLAVLWPIGVNYIRGYFIQEPSQTIDYDFKTEKSVI
jgi:diguanylate cyclase (GGDEF)-like protein/PAS domain S-box-containing protein